MDLTQLANVGEFIGGVAVLATLIYLAVQVRTSALEQRVTAAREATRELAGVLQSVVTTSERAELFLAGMTDMSGLEPAQRLRFSAIVGHLVRLFEQLFYQNQAGRVDPEVWEGFDQQLHDLAAYPGIEAWWPTRSHWYGRRFRVYFDSHLSEDNVPKLYGAGPPHELGSHRNGGGSRLTHPLQPYHPSPRRDSHGHQGPGEFLSRGSV